MQITTLHEKAQACASIVMITWLTIRIEVFLLNVGGFMLVFPRKIAYTEHAYLSCAGMPG